MHAVHRLGVRNGLYTSHFGEETAYKDASYNKNGTCPQLHTGVCAYRAEPRVLF